MKATLIAISIGAILASASHAAFAEPTATTTQTGIGNSAYTEQTLVGPNATISATIIQVGNNNVAGDPALQTPGIFQRGAKEGSQTHALISQEGDEHAAAIVQDGTKSPVNAEIVQFGLSNEATVTQTVMTWGDGMLRQEGVNNSATLEQVGSGDLTFQGSQNGADNMMRVRQQGAAFGASSVTQTGSLNVVNVDQLDTLGAFTIEQIGDLNTVTSTMSGDVDNAIRQTGNGNTATSSQAGFHNDSSIVQSGDNNLASLSQTLGSNSSSISQIGNTNQATVTQTGSLGADTNKAYINQVGNGFVASVTQTGGANNAGIYQH